MLPLYPTLLFQPRKETLDRLLDLVIAIDCPLEDLNTRSYFIENYIHCNKTKLLIKKDKSEGSKIIVEKTKEEESEITQ